MRRGDQRTSGYREQEQTYHAEENGGDREETKATEAAGKRDRRHQAHEDEVPSHHNGNGKGQHR